MTAERCSLCMSPNICYDRTPSHPHPIPTILNTIKTLFFRTTPTSICSPSSSPLSSTQHTSFSPSPRPPPPSRFPPTPPTGVMISAPGSSFTTLEMLRSTSFNLLQGQTRQPIVWHSALLSFVLQVSLPHLVLPWLALPSLVVSGVVLHTWGWR